ncbi:hypothetical protein TRFO_19306 [Tritrichomonas foetus]|uniref:Uncharacterized protein n=1 Tax=Tritrichomonas foetus TaxID=1144522 RepID=A0A1J4KIZ6_9EUKA|nr:hypothetical protein TRFO_19306 [Tritrichomonas foetus]|eukprot:OHT11321.1 hypothetical protein TRFO_19306 [Tritrichomonas foetus]
MNDFDRWRSDFVSSLDLNYNFNEHIETCEQYIEEIIQYNIIKYVGPEKTNSFLTETLKFAIDQIMNFRINNSNRLKCGILIHFLKLTTVLIPYSFLNDIFDLFPILESILDSTHPFYQSLKTGNNTIQQLNVIKQYIVSHEMLALMATRIQKNEETPITATHFIFFFNLYSILSDLMNSNTKSSLLFTIFPVFSEFINDISNYDIKDINAEEVELLFNSAIKILIATDEFSDEI